MMGNGKGDFETELESRDGLMEHATREIGSWAEHTGLDSSNIKVVIFTKENSDIAKQREMVHTSTCREQFTLGNGETTCRKVSEKRNGQTEAPIRVAT